MSQLPDARHFRVHARHVDSHYARLIEEPSFEAAAVAYAEHFDLAIAEDHTMSVIVHEIGTGREHCFKIDLETGDASACS